MLQARSTKDTDAAAYVQKGIIGKFLDARTALKGAGKIKGNVSPQLYVGSTETNGASAVEIYENIMKTDWMQGNGDIIGGIYYGFEDSTSLSDMQTASAFIHDLHKKIVWMPYVTATTSPESLVEYAEVKDRQDGINPLFDVIILQPSLYYFGTEKNLNNVFAAVKKYNDNPKSATRVGVEMEFDMGLITGRRDGETKMDPSDKRTIFNQYLQQYREIKNNPAYQNMPIGIYSGGPNEQGYNDIRQNRNTHNSGNHIPYWEGIVDEWYATGVHYADFPSKYSGNPMYDLNEYFYHGTWAPALSTDLWLDAPK